MSNPIFDSKKFRDEKRQILLEDLMRDPNLMRIIMQGATGDVQKFLTDTRYIKTFTEIQPVSEKYSWSRYFQHYPLHWDGFLWYAFEKDDKTPDMWRVWHGFRWQGEDYELYSMLRIDPYLVNHPDLAVECLVRALDDGRERISEKLLSGEWSPTP